MEFGSRMETYHPVRNASASSAKKSSSASPSRAGTEKRRVTSAIITVRGEQATCDARNYNTLVLRVSRTAVLLLFWVSFVRASGLDEIPALPPLKGDLQQKYDAYIAATEARIQREVRSAPYLWAERWPERWRRVRRGDVVVESWNAHGETEVGNGLIHDWIGALFIPDMTLARVASFLQDYDVHKNYFRPEVIESRLVGRDGDNWRLRYRVVKKYFITLVVNTDQTANYYQLSGTRMITRSVATHIAEVKNVGKPGERELDPRKESTIVWRLNTYWRLEEKDGGVYVECQAISLTRAAPVGLGWLVNPIVRSLPGASVAHLLEATRAGAQARTR